MDENNRVDSEKRSSHPPPPSAKRIKKVLKRNEQDDLSLGTRLIMETGGTKGKSINRSRYEDDLSPFRIPSVISRPPTFLITKEKSIEKISTPTYTYIYIYVKRINSPAGV